MSTVLIIGSSTTKVLAGRPGPQSFGVHPAPTLLTG